MAAVPTPGSGSIVIANNMRDARQHGMSRNMATASTYYWFYQKVRNGGPRDYKKFDPYFAAFGNFNFGAAGIAAGIPANILLMGAGWAQGRAGTSKPGWENGMKNHPMAMTRRTNAISETE
ncbi:type IV secretion protein Rhs [Lelliottia jeotgali]|nr:type IV secretion protein Rhs [Lelliottia jeotgali]